MFNEIRSRWQRWQRKVWKRNQQNMGRRRFLLLYTVISGSCVFNICHYALYPHISRGHSKPALDLFAVPICIGLGYLVSLYSWRRGLRLTGAADE
jgi:hypothetical protein